MRATPKSPTTPNSPKKPATPARQEVAEPIGIVVRRGALRRYEKLIRAAETVPVAVTWDRRTSSEPAPGGQKADRRQKPPFTWDVADFVVVAQAPDRAPAPRAKKRPAAKKTSATSAARGAEAAKKARKTR